MTARPATYQDCDRARALVMRYGWNATAYQILNPGISHWFAPDTQAVIGYVRRRRRRVVAGAPVCDEADLARVVGQFETHAQEAGERVCYFGAAGRIREMVAGNPSYSTIVLGSQPVWNPQQWAARFDAVASLRAQRNRAHNKGIRIDEWQPGRVRDNPDLLRLLHEWLETRSLPPMRFLVEPQTLGVVDDRRFFVALRGGQAVGFVTLSPVPCRNGWLVEQVVRGTSAPNGVAEALIDHAARTIAASGATYFTLGLVPLSHHSWSPENYSSRWLRWTLAWVRAHGLRFYNFGGLDRFKSKFQPQVWEPIYAISHEAHFSPRTLYAIADAFSEPSALHAVGAGLVKAVAQEVRWIAGRRPPVVPPPAAREPPP